MSPFPTNILESIIEAVSKSHHSVRCRFRRGGLRRQWRSRGRLGLTSIFTATIRHQRALARDWTILLRPGKAARRLHRLRSMVSHVGDSSDETSVRLGSNHTVLLDRHSLTSAPERLMGGCRLRHTDSCSSRIAYRGLAIVIEL